jgi:response regulator RpfG family c-di-GMP phosphodiesterase
MKHKLLIVDDEPANLRMLERLFAKDYYVLTATSGEEGLRLLENHDVVVILSDQRMPGMTGLEFLKRSAQMRAYTVRMILTGYTDIDTVVEAINSGVVYKYLTKPWSNVHLQQSIARAVDYYETNRSAHLLAEEIRRLKAQMRASVLGFSDLVVEVIGRQSPKVAGHARRTAEHARRLGSVVGIEGAELEQLFLAALLHETAHAWMPQHLLLRTTRLRDGELRVMREHFLKGVERLAKVPELAEVAEIINYQHDHFDGNGSLGNLIGDQIPLNSRIVAIADAYDEMREPANTASGLSHAECLAVLRGAAGRKFDPVLVNMFCQLPDREEMPVELVASA